MNLSALFATLARRLQLDPDEARRALSLGGVLFGITSSYTLVKTARDALFLANLPATLLPYVYLGVGVLAILASAIFARLTRRRSMWETLAGAALAVAISLAVFAQLFSLHQTWVPVAFYLWVNVYGLILTSQFWIFANTLSQPREAKRTFSVLGIGGILGGLVGGLLAAPLVQLWSLPSLLVVAAIAQALVGLQTWRTARREAAVTAADSAVEETGPAPHPLANGYVRLLAAMTLCSVMVTSLLDFQFKVEIQRRFADGAALASFLGLFYVATNLGALTLQVFGTRWLIQRMGAGWTAAVLPTGLAIGTAATIAFPGFLTVSFSRWWDQITRLSVNKAASELFYFPLTPGARRRAKALIEAGLERAGDGLAGLVILAAGLTIGVGTRTLAWVIGALVIAWVLAWLGVRRGYVRELGINLRRLNLDPQHVSLSLREASLLGEMVKLLDSRFELIVRQGIEMLEDNAPETLAEHLPRLLDHPSPRVRARALELVRMKRVQSLAPRVQELLKDEDAEVRVQALSTSCALTCEDPVVPLEQYIREGDASLRHAAIHALAENAPESGIEHARDVLKSVLESGDAADRIAVAEALGRRKPPSRLHDLIAPTLKDAHIDVRRAGLKSAGKAERRIHVPALIEAVGVRATEAAARAGLAAFGDRIVGTLGDYVVDDSVSLSIRTAIPRVLGDIGSQEAVNALFRYRDRVHVRLGYRVLKAANRIRASGAAVRFPRARVREDLQHDARSYLFALVHYRACPIGRGYGAERLLCITLNERMEQSLNRVFRRLSLVYRSDEIMAAYQGILSNQPRLRGSALEYLDNALDPEDRALVLPLVDDTGDDEKLRWAETRFGIRYVDFDRTLEAIMEGDDAWLKACALYVVGSRKDHAMLPFVESNLSAFDALVRETAKWARGAIRTATA